MYYERKFNQWNINFLTQKSLIYITIKHLTSNDIFHESFKSNISIHSIYLFQNERFNRFYINVN